MRQRGWLAILIIGGVLLISGAGMRVYAQIVNRDVETRLVRNRPSLAQDALHTNATNPIPLADGVPSLIRLPALKLWNTLAPVTLDATPSGLAWQVVDAGWHVASGVPGSGQNVVIAGHSPSRDPETWAHSVFRQLAYLHPGERLELVAGSRTFRYEVVRVFAIPAREAADPASTQWIAPGDAERLTLVTCWPPHTAEYRVIVIAVPISSAPDSDALLSSFMEDSR
jgi:LPXTG-site transpeptidase (sortase) family protein